MEIAFSTNCTYYDSSSYEPSNFYSSFYLLEGANYGRMHAVSVTFILKLEEFKEKVLILKAITFLATKMIKEQ